MATGKKSFIVYTDSKSLVDKLPDETAGKVFKMLFEYVNDKNPKTDDVLVDVAFEHFKQKLKKDLTKWENERKKRSEAGKKGMESRWKHNKTITKDNSVINGITKITDNVNVNVNVNDIYKKKIDKRKTEFKNSLPTIDDKVELNKFFEYWTEHSERDRKMRYEKEKSFNITRRLNTWLSNKQKWEKEKSSAKKENINAGTLLKQKYGFS